MTYCGAYSAVHLIAAVIVGVVAGMLGLWRLSR